MGKKGGAASNTLVVPAGVEPASPVGPCGRRLSARLISRLLFSVLFGGAADPVGEDHAVHDRDVHAFLDALKAETAAAKAASFVG